jgi:hypothetical protein
MLTGIAVSSARSAWAAGLGDPGYPTAFARWNGTDWRVAASPHVEDGVLTAIALAPHGQAWAVGWAGGAPLIMRYSGSSWRRVRVPALDKHCLGGQVDRGTGPDPALARPLLAVGADSDVRHRPRTGAVVSGVAAFSDGNAWAVGYPSSGYGFILAWNRAQW